MILPDISEKEREELRQWKIKKFGSNVDNETMIGLFGLEMDEKRKKRSEDANSGVEDKP